MKAWLFAGVLAAGGAACTKPNPALSCDDGLCSDPLVPFCDVTGAISGEANTCIKPSCTANAFEECRGDKALMCNSSGDDYDLVTCSQGCSADTNGCKPEPPCETLQCEKHIIPKYLPAVCTALATSDLTISTNTSWDTSDAAICTSVIQQTTGPEICVVHKNSIRIEQLQTLQVTGSRALALVADQTLSVAGVLDVSASGNVNGPAGGLTVSGGTAGNTKAGGGAGYRTPGGPGASGNGDGGAANGGAMLNHPTQASYLFGGAKSDTIGGAGGGGAVTLISCRGELAIAGSVDAGGGGGYASTSTGLNQYVHARGGGAGGTIVLQGLKLNITGGLFANGGAGGGANAGGGTDGQDGQRSTIAALGGTNSGSIINGGDGGTISNPGPGKNSGGVGAGGGAAGYLLVYSPSIATSLIAPSSVSPPIETPESIPTN